MADYTQTNSAKRRQRQQFRLSEQNGRKAKMADFCAKSATSNAPSADAGNERETYDARK